MSDRTKTILGTVIFLALTVGIIYFAATQPFMVLALSGFIFFGCGLLGIIKNGITGSWGLMLMLVLGGGIMVVSLSYAEVPFVAGIRSNDQILRKLFCVSFIVAGLILLLCACYEESWKKKHCTYPVQAQCTEVRAVWGVWSRERVYDITWKYSYDGKDYYYQPSERSNWQRRSLPEEGEEYLIWINPSKPEEAFVPIDPSLKVQKFVGIACIAFGILAFYFAFYK
ncbi:MAG: DUF3592 domain-containing protein [Lachnospiraceae bacterium]|nr:DUF3592 domain-containing protein [Lachnospiraceae bacterium]